MDPAVPKSPADTAALTIVDADLAHTILLDGNREGKFYVYHGKSDTATLLEEYTLEELRPYILSEKKNVAADKTPFFIIKWGADAKYNDVINVIDELKTEGISKYALTKISRAEFEKLSAKTGRKYQELSESQTN